MIYEYNFTTLFHIYKHLHLYTQTDNRYSNSKSFGFINQQIKILKFTKPKSLLRQNVKFEHFERILHHSTKDRKYAKYEGLF